MFSLLFVSFVVLVRSQCPDGYTFSAHNNKCYKFVSQHTANFKTAQNLCQGDGGNLASIHSEGENVFIQNALGLYSAWHFIGLDVLARPHTWTDGSPIDYTSWAPGEPSKASCATFDSLRGQWGSYDCSLPLPYICQLSSSPPPACPNVTLLPPPTCPPPSVCPSLPPPTACPTATTRPPLTCPPPPPCPVPTTKPAPTCPPPKPSCDTDWTYLASTKSCYFAYWGATWTNAENYCKSHGAHLASIHSDEENNLVYLLGKSGYGGDYPNNVWIGMYKSGEKWIYSDGTPVNYTQWSPGEPNNKDGNEGCVQLYSDPVGHCKDCGLLKWNDYKCGYTLRSFVCKKNALL